MPKVKEEYYWIKADNTVKQIDWEQWQNLKEDKKRIRIIGEEVMFIHHNKYLTFNKGVLKAVLN